MPDSSVETLFLDSLRCGHGRVHALFAQLAPEVACKVLLEACLQNGVYDQQCEPSLAPWLYEWVRQFRCERDVCDAVVGAMTSEPPPCDHDQYQLIELLRLFAAEADETARSALYSLLARSNDEAALCDAELADAVIALDGSAGFVAAARAVGMRIGRCEEWNKTDHLLDAEQLEELSEQEIDALLSPYLHEPNVAALWERIQQHRATEAELARERALRREEKKRNRGKPQRRPRFGIEALQVELERHMRRIEEADTEGPPMLLPYALRKEATEEMLWPLAQWLAEEQRPEQLRRLLITFRVTPPPVVPPRVYELARDGTHGEIQAAALRLLSNVGGPAVRELALELLTAPDRARAVERGAVRLLQDVYETSDAEIISPALDELGHLDRDARHDVGCNILDVAEKREDAPELAPPLEWVYENTPCMHCRHQAVERMLKYGALASRLAEECRHDGCEWIREIVADAFDRH